MNLYFDIRIQDKPNERVFCKDFPPSKTIKDLKLEAENLLNHPNNELEFIYCGDKLEDEEKTLTELQVKNGSTIHVFQKEFPPKLRDMTVTDEDIQAAVFAYLKIFIDNGISKSIRPEVLKEILKEYPEFHTQLGAYAFLKDGILLNKIVTYELAKKIAETYPILVVSAKFVVKTVMDYMKLTSSANRGQGPIRRAQTDESSLETPSTSDDDESPGEPSTSTRNPMGALQITRDQLEAALNLAGSSSLNSLSNLANRSPATVGGNEYQLSGDMQTENPPQPALTNPTTPSTSTSSTSSTAQTPHYRITSAAFSDALSRALIDSIGADISNPINPVSQPQPPVIPPPLGTVAAAGGVADEPMDIVASDPAAVAAAPIANVALQYASQLQVMQEMGLTDEQMNLQALIVCDGNVEDAINLCFAETRS